MNLKNPLRRGVLAVALALLGVGAATAGDETRIGIRTQAGAIERLTIQDIGTIAVGERRALTTEGGNAATLERTEAGYVLEVAGERFELDALAHEPGAQPGKRVIVRKHAPHAGEGEHGSSEKHERVVVLRRPGDEAMPGDLPALAELDALEPGEGARVVVVRRITRDQTEQ